MSEVPAAAQAIALDEAAPVAFAVSPRPYAPTWIHPLGEAIDRLPGPRWLAYAGIAIAGILLQHAQLWSTGPGSGATLRGFLSAILLAAGLLITQQLIAVSCSPCALVRKVGRPAY